MSESPLRLLRVVHSMNPVGGGVAEAIRQFGLVAENAGCALTVACLDNPGSDYLKELPFKVVALGPAKGAYGYCAALRPWLDENLGEFDVAVIDGLWMYHGLVTYKACREQGLPYCVMPHGMLDPWFKQRYRLKHLKKYLYWWAVEYRILRDAAKVIFTAGEESRKARQSFWPYRVRDAVVPLGIQAPEFDFAAVKSAFRNAHPCLGDDPYLLFIGRLNEKKGVDILIKAYRALEASCDSPTTRLVVAGPEQDAAFAKHLYQLAEGSDRIHFTGMLSGKIKWGALAGAQAMVLPSHQENFGVVVAESLAVGTPVLLSREIDIWREVCDAGAGWVEADTEVGVFSLLQKQQSANEATWQDLRIQAKRCFRKCFNAKRSALKMKKAFCDCLGFYKQL